MEIAIYIINIVVALLCIWGIIFGLRQRKWWVIGLCVVILLFLIFAALFIKSLF